MYKNVLKLLFNHFNTLKFTRPMNKVWRRFTFIKTKTLVCALIVGFVCLAFYCFIFNDYIYNKSKCISSLYFFDTIFQSLKQKILYNYLSNMYKLVDNLVISFKTNKVNLQVILNVV